MSTIPRASRALPTVTLVGAALVSVALSAAPDAAATTVGTSIAAPAAARMPAPTLTSATVKGDNVRLLWRPPAGGGAFDHAIFADGAFVHRTLSPDSATIFLTAEGLTGREAYTVVAEDGAGDRSPPSNAMTPRPAATLPAPELTGAVLGADRVTLTWVPSRTEEMSGEITYFIFANRFLAMSVQNGTGAQVPLSLGPFALSGREVFTVVARDQTMAESPPSNGLVPTKP